MKRVITIIMAAIMAQFILVGCGDEGGFQKPPAELDISPVSVGKADLVNAVWGEADLKPEADCLAGSSFKITSENKFKIVNKVRADKRLTDTVLVISDVTIMFKDPKNDGRGAKCNANDNFGYTITVTEEDPMEIETTGTVKNPLQSPNIVVNGTKPTDYPKCEITANFDKAGTVVCAVQPLNPGGGSTNMEPVLIPSLYIQKAQILKAEETNADGVPCGDAEVRDVKLVITEIDCSVKKTTNNLTDPSRR